MERFQEGPDNGAGRACGTVVRNLLERLAVGEPIAHGNMTVFGLVLPPEFTVDLENWATLDEATASGWLTVEEVSEGGRVPEMAIKHGGETPVLILDGEEVIGAKQNRVLNTTILILPGRRVVIPVSCVERGRWHYRTRAAQAAGTVLYSSLRSRKAAQVAESLRSDRGFVADQGAIWADITAVNCSMGVASDTDAMHDLYESRQEQLNEYLETLRPGEDWSGAAFFIGGRLSGLEILSEPDLLRRQWRKLVLSHAIDALARRAAGGGTGEVTPEKAPHPGVVERLIRTLAESAELSERPSVGAGTDVRLRLPDLLGAALVNREKVVHLAVFPVIAERSHDLGDESEADDLDGDPDARNAIL